jgi:hypothetical protein
MASSSLYSLCARPLVAALRHARPAQRIDRHQRPKREQLAAAQQNLRDVGLDLFCVRQSSNPCNGPDPPSGVPVTTSKQNIGNAPVRAVGCRRCHPHKVRQCRVSQRQCCPSCSGFRPTFRGTCDHVKTEHRKRSCSGGRLQASPSAQGPTMQGVTAPVLSILQRFQTHLQGYLLPRQNGTS